MTVRMLTGDCRAMLATLPDASVQMVCTSPPYFGLRSYGTEPQVWGGDANCEHDWQHARYYVEGGGGAGKSAEAFSKPGEANAQRIKDARWREDDTCSRCGAWCGHAGLEPTVERSVQNMVAVFRGVRRVLRDDGVLFLNLGDSYAGSWGNQGRKDERGTQRPINGGMLTPVHDGRYPSNGSNTGSIRDDGLKPKDLIGIPWRVAFALQQPWLTCRGCGTENHLSQWASFPNGRRICPACELSKGHDISESGWYLRSDIIWAKPNPMPESVTDRCTKSHEYLFMLTKSARYFYDGEAIKEAVVSGPSDIRKMEEGLDRIGGLHKDLDDPLIAATGLTNIGRKRSVGNPSGRNARSVWAIATEPFPGSHFAVFPKALAERCIKAGTSEKGKCSACGAPWIRTTERESVPKDRPTGRGWSEAIQGQENWASGTPTHSGLSNGAYAVERTTGWQPTCPCDAPIVPCVVLDCFGGAGTVSLVSERLGRDSIYVDLSSDYAAMARKRITGDAPMFATVELA